LKRRIENLKAEIASLEIQIGPVGDAEGVCSNHIQLLHKYNGTMDAAGVLIGRLAELEGCSVVEIYKRLGLSVED